MLGTALTVGAGLLILGVCLLGLRANLRQRMNRATRAEAPDPERAEALRQIARDIDKGYSARGGFF